MNGDDTTQSNAADGQDDTLGEEQEITLTFSYEPQATLEELFGIGEETLFHAFDLALARVGVAESVEVSVLITTDEGIRTLNRDFRGRDEATDVLSFPLLDHPIVQAPADQLWQPGEEEEDGSDDSDDDFSDEDDGEQALKGKIVLLGDDQDDFDDDFDDEADEDAFGDDSEVWPTHLGDIAIARETALRQAQQAGHSAAWELAFLFVHGVLHLVGFDDHTDAGYQAMVAHQEAVLAEAGVTR
ncbi:MAG TPA: rRNA maturation RNase YbeY [Ktedonobacterales bacterium]|jgi:probable rRNA maturation factor